MSRGPADTGSQRELGWDLSSCMILKGKVREASLSTSWHARVADAQDEQ